MVLVIFDGSLELKLSRLITTSLLQSAINSIGTIRIYLHVQPLPYSILYTIHDQVHQCTMGPNEGGLGAYHCEIRENSESKRRSISFQ